jgi:hypothetical protein
MHDAGREEWGPSGASTAVCMEHPESTRAQVPECPGTTLGGLGWSGRGTAPGRPCRTYWVGLDPGALGFESAKVKRPCSIEALPISRRLTNGSGCLARVPGANSSLSLSPTSYVNWRTRSWLSICHQRRKLTRQTVKLVNSRRLGGWEFGCLTDCLGFTWVTGDDLVYPGN